MTPTDIDALARLLDGDPTLNGEVTAETRALGQIAHHLLEAPPVPVRAEFKAALRAELVEAARQVRAPSAVAHLRTRVSATTARWRRSPRVAAATASVVLALSGSGGMAIAADRALPNDVLYPAKLVLEDVRIALVLDGAHRGEAHLEQARDRVTEAEAVAVSGDQAAAAQALTKAGEAARSGANQLLRAYMDAGDARALEQLAAFTSEQQRRLDELDGVLSGDADAAARTLAAGLERIEARLVAARGPCGNCPERLLDEVDWNSFPTEDSRPDDDLAPSGTPRLPVAPDPATPADEPTTPPGEDTAPIEPPTEPPVDPAEPPTDPPVVTDPPIGEDPPQGPPDQPVLPLPDMPEPREPSRHDDGNILTRLLRGVVDLLDG